MMRVVMVKIMYLDSDGANRCDHIQGSSKDPVIG